MFGGVTFGQLPFAALPGTGTPNVISPLDARVLAKPKRRNLPVFKSLADLEREQQKPTSAPVEKQEVAPKPRKPEPKPHPILRKLIGRIDLPDRIPRGTFDLDKVAEAIGRANDKALADAKKAEERASLEIERAAAEAERQRLEEEAEAERARQAHARQKAITDRRLARLRAAKVARESEATQQAQMRLALEAVFRHQAAVERLADLLAADRIDNVAVRKARKEVRQAGREATKLTGDDRTMIEVAGAIRMKQRLDRISKQLLGALEAAASDSNKRTKKQIENLLAAIEGLSALQDD